MKTARHQTIVMIDDDEDDYYFFRAALEQQCSTCQTVLIDNSAVVEDVLSRLNSTPNLFVLDLHMPVKDGFTVLNELRSHPRYQNVPVVIFTSVQDPINANKATELGANLFLEKPASHLALQALIEQQIQSYLL